jgi:hypothetical protein
MRARSIVFVVLLLVACSKKETEKEKEKPKESPATTDTGGVDFTSFCKHTMAGANPAQCYGRDKQSEQIKVGFCVDVLRSGVTAGRVSIDAAKLAACEEAAVAGAATLSNQRSLTDLAEAFEACRGVTTGSQPAGAECIGTMECAPGLVCSQMKCQTPGAEGDKCFPVIEMTMAVVDSSCADNLYCDVGDNVCRPRVAKGAACVLSDECAQGLQCRNKTCTPAAPSKAGEECDDTRDCPAGHFCTIGGGKCEPLRADGESCLSNTECAHQCVSDKDSFSGSCGPC